MKRLARLLLGSLLITTGIATGTVSISVHADVNGVRVWQSPDHVRLVLDLSKAHEHKVFQLTSPDRIVIDLAGADLNTDLNKVEIADTDIIGLRSGRRNKTDLRLVVETTTTMAYKLLRAFSVLGQYETTHFQF